MYIRRSKKRHRSCLKFFVCFLIILFAVRSLQYNPDAYVCVHMARDVEDVFEFMGVDTQIVIGQSIYAGETGHAWVRVNGIDIDSVWLIPHYWRLKNFQRDVIVYDDFRQYACDRDFASKW